MHIRSSKFFLKKKSFSDCHSNLTYAMNSLQEKGLIGGGKFEMNKQPDSFVTGDRVPSSGIYSVEHTAHQLFAEVAMFQGEVSPRCAHCSSAVTFRRVRAFPGLDIAGVPTFRVPLTELQEL